MPYRFIDDVATADVAFEASGPKLEDVFQAAAAALLAVMVSDPRTIAAERRVSVSLEAESTEMLLFDFLQELVFLKDRDQILLEVHRLSVETGSAISRLKAEMAGERLDYAKHDLLLDVKAVTLHQFRLAQTAAGWRARVILDI